MELSRQRRGMVAWPSPRLRLLPHQRGMASDGIGDGPPEWNRRMLRSLTNAPSLRASVSDFAGRKVAATVSATTVF